MRKLVGILALGAMVSFAASAGAITADGNWSDWFSYGGNTNFTNWNENLVSLTNTGIRTQNDEEGPTPGGGGQTYDIEQIFYYYEDAGAGLTGGTLYIGLVTGFPSTGVPSDNLYCGDMFIDFGNTGGYDMAIAVSERATEISELGNTYINDGTANWQETTTTSFSIGNPYRVVRNPAIEQSASFGTQVAWGGSGVHNFLEICLTVDGALEEILTNQDGGIGLHWTMQCGNDVINVHDDTPFPPVPEPSTFALLGLGMLGVGLRRKFAA